MRKTVKSLRRARAVTVAAAILPVLLLGAGCHRDKPARAVAVAPPHVARPPAKPSPTPAIPTIALAPIGTITLGATGDDANPTQGPDRKTSPIHDVDAFGIDDRGRFGFIEGCGCDRTFVLVDRNGQLVRSIALPVAKGAFEGTLRAAWIAGNRWLLMDSGDRTHPATAQWLDVGTSATTPIPAFAASHVVALASTRDGGFAVVSAQGDHDANHVLTGFDGSGRPRWTHDLVAANTSASSDPESLAVTRSRDIVVLDGLQMTLQVFGKDGRLLRTLPLANAWGGQSVLSATVQADPRGGYLVGIPSWLAGAQSQSRLLHVTDGGGVVPMQGPAFRDGREFGPKSGLQVDAQGHLWATDGDTFVRVGRDGVVDRMVGEGVDPQILGRIDELAIDAMGNIRALDARSHAVHLFDADGVHQHVGLPDVADSASGYVVRQMAVSPNGETYVIRTPYDESPGRVARFGADGIRVDAGTLPTVTQSFVGWFFQPSGNRWFLSYDSVVLADSAGRTIAKDEHLVPGGGEAIVEDAAMAPDGSLAVMSMSSDWVDALLPDDNGGDHRMTLVSTDGSIAGMWKLPTGVDGWRGGPGSHGFAVDGQHVAFVDRSSDAQDKTSIVVTDLAGKALYRIATPGSAWQVQLFAVVRDGVGELWVYDGTRTIHRYRLPRSA